MEVELRNFARSLYEPVSPLVLVANLAEQQGRPSLSSRIFT